MAAQGTVYLPFLESQLVSPFVDFDNDTIKAMLVTSAYTFDSGHQFRSEITNEASGTNYVSGGQTITNVIVNTVGNTVTVNGDDNNWAGAASAPFTFRGIVIYKDTGAAATDPVISYHAFEADQTNSGANVVLKWSVNFIVAYQTVDVVTELSDLTDVNTSTPTNRNVLVADGVNWESRPLVEADISDLNHPAEVNDLTAAVTWASVPDANITQSSVVQHEAALTLTESQISDLGAYIENVLEDLTPQLGGDLDVNGNSIVSTPTLDISIVPGTTGNVNLGTMTFDTDQVIGPAQDNFVLTYDDGTGEISLQATASTVTELSDLTDVNTSTPTNRNVLVADGVDFESRALVEADISDLQAYLTTLDGVTAGNINAEASLDGYVLTSDGLGNAAWEANSGGTALQNVVEDLTPQLGGNLDVNNFDITSSVNDLNITASFGGAKVIIDGDGGVEIADLRLTSNMTVGVSSIRSDSGSDLVLTPGSALDNTVISRLQVSGPVTGGGTDISIQPGGTSNVILGNYQFDADQVIGVGQDNYVLTYDNATGIISLEENIGGLQNVVEDLSPQLGGDLDVNGFDITGNQIDIVSTGSNIQLTSGFGDIQLTAAGGDVQLGTTGDTDLTFANGANSMFFGSAGTVFNINSGGAEQIRFNNFSANQTLQLWLDPSTTSRAPLYMQAGVAPTTPVAGEIWNAANDLYYQNASGTINVTTPTIVASQVDAEASTTGYVLTSDGGGNAVWQIAPGTNPGDLVDDLTPQLGGDLDVNGWDIVSVANGNINILPNGTGDVALGNFLFDADQTVGAGQDNYVLQYDHATGKISLEVNGAGTMSELIDDITPQLGGTLDANGFNIDMGVNIITDALVGSWMTDLVDDTTPQLGGTLDVNGNPINSTATDLVLQQDGAEMLRLDSDEGGGFGAIDISNAQTIRYKDGPNLVFYDSTNAQFTSLQRQLGQTVFSGLGGVESSLKLQFAGVQFLDSNPSNWISIDMDGVDGVITSQNATDLNIVGFQALGAGNYVFDIDQTVGAGQDNYVLTYDNALGTIQLEPQGAVNLTDIADVTITGPVGGNEILAYDNIGGEWINRTAAEANLASASHTHDTSDITTGTFADARIAESNVTQHEAAIDHDALTNFVANEHIDWTAIGAGTIDPSNYVDNDTTDHTLLSNIGTNTHAQIDTHIADSSIHFTQAAISITESQISDLQSYLLNVVEDTSPQLGGGLDTNGFNITSAGGADVSISPSGTGNILLGTLTIDADQTVGVGQDNYILTYDHGTGLVALEAAPAEVNDLTAAVTWANVPDANITQSSVTQHEAALTITESQISDLQSYLLNVADDLTPQLGGDLDVTGFDIITSAGNDINLLPSGTGDVRIGNFILDGDQSVGAGQDNYVMTYDHATLTVSLEANPGVTALQNVVEDTTPQLGGTLDVNGNTISSNTDNLDISVDSALGTGYITLTNPSGGVGSGLELGMSGPGDFAEINCKTGNLTMTGFGINSTAQIDTNITFDTSGTGSIDISSVNGDISLNTSGTGNISLGNFTFDADQTVAAGQDNYVLTYDNGTGLVSLEANPGVTALQNIVEDTTPQLGGDLDVTGFDIITSAGNDINLLPSGTGDVRIGNFILDGDQSVGVGQDNYVMTYDHSTLTVSLEQLEIVNDTTPQLGGNLDLAGFDLQGRVTVIDSGTDDAQYVLPEYTVATVPSTPERGSFVYVSDGDTGGLAGLYCYDGVVWQPISFGLTSKWLQDVVEDTTPQLGGNLDVQANQINTSTVNGDIDIQPNGTGNVLLGNLEFNADTTVGATQDGYVLSYDNATGEIDLSPTATVLVATGSATNVASLDFTDLVTDFGRYQLVIHNVVPATDGADLNMQVSTNNGVSFITTANYNWAMMFARIRSTGGSASGNEGTWQDTSMRIMSSMGTGTGEDGSGIIDIFDPTSGTYYTRINTRMTQLSAQPETRTSSVGGEYSATTAVDAFRLIMSTGNIATIEYTLYGYRQ